VNHPVFLLFKIQFPVTYQLRVGEPWYCWIYIFSYYFHQFYLIFDIAKYA